MNFTKQELKMINAALSMMVIADKNNTEVVKILKGKIKSLNHLTDSCQVCGCNELLCGGDDNCCTRGK